MNRKSKVNNTLLVVLFVLFLFLLSAILGHVSFASPKLFMVFILATNTLLLVLLTSFVLFVKYLYRFRVIGILNCVVLICVSLSLLLVPGVIDFLGTKSNLIFSNSAQFPLGRQGVAGVSSSGEIFVTLDEYSRVQKYNSAGVFSSGWFIATGGGVFSLWVDNDDKVHVCTRRTHKHLIFNLDGKLLEKINIESEEEKSELFKTASKNNILLKSNSSLVQKLIGYNKLKLSDNLGKEKVQLATPWYLVFSNTPLPVLFYFLISILSGIVFQIYKRG